MREFFLDKVILITGAAGSVGQELVRQLLQYNPAEIRAVDNNETELFLLGERYRHPQKVTAYLGDVRDTKKMEHVSTKVDIIFHTAAFKHVALSEYNPFDAVQTNILGVKNVIQAAMHNQVKRVIFTSSDKAVNPTSVMGTSKLMGERLITSANIVNFNSQQIFSSVRFGNVIGSRGSVVPIFTQQILQGGPVTVTDRHMTRFFMTIEEAARLVIEACVQACGGEVFITKMPVIRIPDLARAMIELLAPVYGYEAKAIKIQYFGVRPGEKLYEELMSDEEVPRALELPQVFAVLPALQSFYHQINYHYQEKVQVRSVSRPYVSSQEKPLNLAEVKSYLLKNKVISESYETDFPVQPPRASIQ
jgi:FlaA1/EpsC-like NDP-sugar epimerase